MFILKLPNKQNIHYKLSRGEVCVANFTAPAIGASPVLISCRRMLVIWPLAPAFQPLFKIFFETAFCTDVLKNFKPFTPFCQSWDNWTLPCWDLNLGPPRQRYWKRLSFSRLCVAYWSFSYNFCLYLLRHIFSGWYPSIIPFLPVEHRSYNRVFKPASTILTV